MSRITPERFRALDARLDELLDLGEAERARRMAELGARDPDLAAALDLLLRERDAVERERFLAESLDAAGPVALAGQSLGPYTLVAPLGEGGMGEVWLAEQHQPVRRQVAVKVIKHGMDTAQVTARFEAERQALALMDHSAVARVFDAGSTPQGRPYFVMEYVRGLSITEHCERGALTTRARLDLFRLVCDGVHHAHQKAVIHRDLKPSNVLVTMQDGKPVPKIIDFGIAKATAQRLTDRTLDTACGAVVGTPEYMSPEQADLAGEDIDTRSDVYSLGVMLYQLLVGVLPFESREAGGGGADDIRRRIREEEPRKPSARLASLGEAVSAEIAQRRRADRATLRRQLRGDLDWVVMKALEKDRTRRYGSAADLAADIGRHLANLPVVAGPPSARYRARKFVRRHRMGVAVGALAAIGVLVFALAMARQSARIARERDRANREATTANRALGFLTELFEVSNPSEARGNTVTAREILDRGAAKIDSELKDEPLVQAKLLMTLGEVYQSLGLEGSARPLLEKSVALRRRLLGEGNRDTLDSLNALATVLQDQGALADAETDFRAVLAGRTRLLGADDADTLVSANNLGLVLQLEGKLPEAESHFRRALEGEKRTLPPEDNEILTSLNNLGLLLQQEGRPAEAEPYLVEVLDRCRRVFGNDHPHTLTAINNMGVLLMAEGRPAEVEPLWREALETRRRVLGPDHPLTLLSTLNMGMVLRIEGRLADADPFATAAAEGSRRVLGAEHPRALGAAAALGMLRHAQGRLPEAEAIERACLAVRRRTLGDDHPDTLDSIYSLGALLHDEGRLDEAEPLLREAVDRGRSKLGAAHPQTLGAMSGLGDLETTRGRLQEAKGILEETLDVARRALLPGHRVTGRTLNAYGRCLCRLGRYPEAEAALTEARGILEKSEPVTLPKVAKNLDELRSRRGPSGPGGAPGASTAR